MCWQECEVVFRDAALPALLRPALGVDYHRRPLLSRLLVRPLSPPQTRQFCAKECGSRAHYVYDDRQRPDQLRYLPRTGFTPQLYRDLYFPVHGRYPVRLFGSARRAGGVVIDPVPAVQGLFALVGVRLMETQ